MNKDCKIWTAALCICCLCACTGEDSIPTTPDGGKGVPINFSATLTDTRADEFTNTTLSSMGVFAYASGTGNYNESTTPLNYIYNVEISKTDADAAWTPASPIFWPLNSNEKLTFFAYAPHTNRIMEAGNNLSLPDFNSAGHPQLTYTNTHPDIDFLFAVPQTDLMKATSTVNFRMMHALTKVSIAVSNSGTRTKKVIRLALKAKKQGTFSYPPSGVFKFQVGDEYITYDENMSYTVELPGGEDTTVKNIKSYYVLPDRTGVALTLTYIEYTDPSDDTGTQYTTVVSDTPDVDAGELSFSDNVPWVPGTSITYQLIISDK